MNRRLLTRRSHPEGNRSSGRAATLTRRSFWARATRTLTVAFITLALTLGQTSMVQALPTGYSVESGDVHIEQPDDATLNITSNSLQSIIRYQQFNIAPHETVNFFLLLPRATLLNHVIGGGPSHILGAMNANGQVFLVNPAGVAIGAAARLNVGSLVISTLQLSDQDFLNRAYVFRRDPAQLAAAIQNEGDIQAAAGGYVALNAGAVVNSGNINAPGGSVRISVGDEIAMRTPDGVAVQVQVDKALSEKVQGYEDAVRNSGTIRADGGLVKLQADLSRQLYARAINNSGVIRAQGVSRDESGKIAFNAAIESDAADQSAVAINTGVLDVSGASPGAAAGDIQLQADVIASSGEIRADTANGGLRGKIDVDARQNARLETGSVTSAAAPGETGDGGDIRIWSDGDTLFQRGALLDVRGGRLRGDGGFAEVSAHRTVTYEGSARGEAPGGRAGALLIDPVNIVIQNGGANPGGGSVLYTANPGVDSTFDPTFFSGFATVNLQATNNITIVDAFSLPSTTSLTLSANNDVNILNALTVGTGATASTVTITADAANGAASDGIGNLNLSAAGSITKLGSGSMTLSGTNVTLDGALTLGSGNVTVNASNHLTLNNTLSVTANSAVSLNADANLSGAASNGVGDLALTAAGSVSKPGTGTLTMTGHNVTLDGAFLSMGAGNVTTSASNHLTLNSLLSVAANSVVSLNADANRTGAAGNGVGDLLIASTGGITKAGSGGLTLNGANITVSGALNNGSGAFIANASNNLTVDAPITSTSGNPGYTLTADANMTGAPTNGVGTLTITGAGSLSATGSGTMSFLAPTIDLDGSIQTGVGVAMFQATQLSRPLEIGGGASLADAEPAGALWISDAELDRINAANLNTIFGSTTQTGGITVVGALSSSRQLEFRTAGTFTNNVGAPISTTNRQVVVTADTVDINEALTAGSGAVYIRPASAARPVEFAGTGAITDAEPAALSLNSAELALITTTGSLNIGQTSNTGGLTILGSINRAFDLNLYNNLSISQPVGSTLTLTSSRSLTMQADSIDLNDAINVGSGNMTFSPAGAARAMQIGGTALLTDAEPGGALLISDTELDLLTNTGTLTLGNTTSTGGTTLLTARNFGNRNVTFASNGATILNAGADVTVTAGKNVGLYGQTVDINAAVNTGAGTGAVSLYTAVATRNIEVGGGVSTADAEPGAAMRVSNPELALLTTGTITIGNDNTGTFTVIGPTTTNAAHLSFYARNLITVNAASPITLANKNLTLRANDLAINSAIDVGTGVLSVIARDTTRPFDIGGLTSPGTSLGLTNAELWLLSAGSVVIGSGSYTNGLTISGDVSVNSPLTLINTGAAGYTAIRQTAGTLTTNGKNLTLQGNQVDLDGLINAGAGTVTILPISAARPVTLASGLAAGASETALADLNISVSEMDAITAAQLTVGATINTGGVTIGSDYDLSGRYNLSINNAGVAGVTPGLTATDRFFNVGSKWIDVNTVSSAMSWTTTGDNRPIALRNVTANGGTVFTTSGANSGVSFNSLTSASATSIETAGVNSNIAITSLGSYGAANVNVLIDALNSDLTITNGITHNGTGLSTVRLNAGHSADGQTVNNAAAILTLGGASSIASGATKSLAIFTGGGSVFSNATLFNRVFTFDNLALQSAADNTGLDFSAASKPLATFNATRLTLRTQGTNSAIQTGGAIAVSGDLDVMAARSAVSVNGALTHSGLSGTSVRLAAGYDASGALQNASAALSLGTVSIANDADKDLTVWSGTGATFSHLYFSNALVFDALDLRSGSNASIGGVTPLAITANTLTLQTLGDANVNNSGSSLTLGSLGAETQVSGALTIGNDQAIATGAAIHAGTLALTTTASNGTITLGHHVSATSGLTLTTHGTGGVVAQNGVSVASVNAPIAISARSLDLQGTSTLNAGTGSITLTPNASGVSIGIGDAGAGTATLDVNASEFGRLTAGSVILGDVTKTGGLTVAGNLSISDRFHLTLANGGDITASGRTIIANNRALSLQTPGAIVSGAVSGDNTTLTLDAGSGITSQGAIALTGAGSSATFSTQTNGGVTFNESAVSAGGLSVSTNGTGVVTVASGKTLSTSNAALTLTARDVVLLGTAELHAGSAGGVTLAPNASHAITLGASVSGAGPFDISAGELSRITAGSVTIGDTAKTGGLTILGDINLAGRYHLDLRNGGNITGSGVSLNRGGKLLTLATPGDVSLLSTASSGLLDISGVSAANLALETRGANAPISLGSDISAGNVSLRALGTGSAIQAGAIASSGNLDILSAWDSVSAGAISHTGAAGSAARLAAGYDADGVLRNASVAISLPVNSLSIAGNAGKTVQIWDGRGDVFSQSWTSAPPTLDTLDLRTAGAHDFGVVAAPLTINAARLTLQTAGGGIIQTSGPITLGGSGSGDSLTLGGDFSLSAVGGVTLANALSASTVTLTTTASNGAITLSGGDINALSAATLTTHGTGGLTLLNAHRLAVANGGAISLRLGALNADAGTIDAGALGSLSLTGNVAGLALDIGDGLSVNPGTLALSGLEISHLLAGSVMLGDAASSGTIRVGAANFTPTGANLTLRTSGAVLDGLNTANATNLTLAAGKNLIITGGAGEGAGGVGAAGSGDFGILTSGGGTLKLITNNQSIYAYHAGSTLIDAIQAGSGAISLVSAGGISQTASAGARLLNTGTLMLSSNGVIGGPTAQGLVVDTGAVTVSGSGGNAVTLTHSGALTLDSIATGGAGNIRLSAAGAIADLDDVGDAIATTGTLTLSSNGAIGATTAQGLNIQTGAVTVSSSGGNAVTLTHSGALTLDNIATGGAGAIRLNAANGISDLNGTDDTAQLTTTGIIDLSASSGSIGAVTNALGVSPGAGAGALSASAINGSVYLKAFSPTLRLGNVTAGGAASISGANLTLDAGKTIAAGNIDLRAQALVLSGALQAPTGVVSIIPDNPVQTIGLDDSASQFNLTDAQLSRIHAATLSIGSAQTQGDVTIGTVSLSGGLSLTTTGRILNGTSQGSNDINLTLGSNGNLRINGGVNVGSGQVAAQNHDLKVRLSGTGKLDVKTNNADVFINLTHGGYLGQVNVGGAGASIIAGNAALGSNGRLLNAGGGDNLIAGSDSTLISGFDANSSLGAQNNPLRILMPSGILRVQASGADNGDSINLTGAVANPIVVISPPPGQIVTDIQFILPPVPNAPPPAQTPYLLDFASIPIAFGAHRLDALSLLRFAHDEPPSLMRLMRAPSVRRPPSFLAPVAEPLPKRLSAEPAPDLNTNSTGTTERLSPVPPSPVLHKPRRRLGSDPT